MGKVSSKEHRLIKSKGFMWIRRKAVNDVDTSVNMGNMIDFQNDDISAPLTPKPASFQKLENMKSPVKEKKTLRIRNNWYENFMKCV